MDPDFINRKVSQEMFDSIVREVVEEIGVPEASLVSFKSLSFNMKTSTCFI